jgi:hypothetical protein
MTFKTEANICSFGAYTNVGLFQTAHPDPKDFDLVAIEKIPYILSITGNSESLTLLAIITVFLVPQGR